MADAEAAAPAMVEVDIKDEDFVAGRSRKEWETMMPGLMSIMLIAFGAAVVMRPFDSGQYHAP